MHVRVTRPPPTHTHTHRHTQIQIHRHRHTQTQTHSHTDTETQTHSHTHTLTHRAARKHGCSFRNRTNLLARGLLDPEFVLHGNHVSLLRPVCALLSQDVGKRVQKRNLLGGGRVREEANPEQQEQQKQQHHQQRSSTAQETCGFLTKRHNTNHALVPSPPLSCPSIAPQMSALPFHAFSFALCSDKTHHLNARRMRGASAWPASSAFSVTALASDLKEAQKKKGGCSTKQVCITYSCLFSIIMQLVLSPHAHARAHMHAHTCCLLSGQGQRTLRRWSSQASWPSHPSTQCPQTQAAGTPARGKPRLGGHMRVRV